MSVDKYQFGPVDVGYAGHAHSQSASNLIVSNTIFQYENVWLSRLRLFGEAERALQKARRLMVLWMLVIVASLCMLFFTLYVAPVSSVWFFVIECVALGTGLILQPVSFLMLKEQRRHRDALSKRFYDSNHEIEVSDSHLTLINRSNYSVVTRAPILER